MTSEPAPEENSPVEPKLSVVKKRLDDDNEDVDPTGPSPLMPSLSPHPLARDAPVEETPIPAERRTAAKKMLVFDGQGANQVGVDDRMRPLEEEDHRLGEIYSKSELGDASLPSMSTSHPRNGEEGFSPQKVNGSHEVKPNSLVTTQVIETSDLQNDNSCHYDTTASSSRINETAKGISTQLQRNALKRPNSASPAGSERKRLRRTLGVISDDETSTNTSQEPNDNQDNLEETTLAAALEEGYHQPDQDAVWSPPFFAGPPAAADDLNLFPVDHEAEEGTESFLLRHGVDLFENPSHRQDLIEFCEKSLTTTHSSQFENSANLNFNNNCSSDDAMMDGRHHATPAANQQFDVIVQRARARGFIVNDAMYFDGKQYVSIKVASNGRGKFRLLLPPDHPHRKGVADEIPILRTFEMESSQEEVSVDDDSFKENN